VIISLVLRKYYNLRSEKYPIPKFSLKSSLIDIYEWLFFDPEIYIYLTSPESTFCPLFFFFDKNILVTLKKVILSRKQSKFGTYCIKYHVYKTKSYKIFVYEVHVKVPTSGQAQIDHIKRFLQC